MPSGVRGMAVCGQGLHLLGEAAYCLWECDKEKGGSQELTVPRSSPLRAKIQDSESSKLKPGHPDCFDIIFVKVGRWI